MIPPNSPPPVAKSYAPYELRGWLKKAVNIPPGKIGIVLYGNGVQKILPAGKSLLLNPYTRLRGDGVGMLVGFVPESPFDLGARFESLLTGDDELLDLQMLMSFELIDTARFFTSLVVPVKELVELPDFGIKPFKQSIAGVISQFEREDLLYHIPTENLASEISASLARLVPKFGIRLKSISYLLMTRPEDRMIIGEKLEQLAGSLDTIQQEQAIADINNKQLSETKVGFFPVTFSMRSMERKPLAEILEDIRNSRALENKSRSHWLLRSLQAPQAEEMSQGEIQQIRSFRAMEFRWIFIFIAIGSIITYFLYRSRIDINNVEIIGLLVSIWGTIFTLAIIRLKKIVEKQELLHSRNSAWASVDNIRYINNKDKREIDKLVRNHCVKELAHTQEILNKVRKHFYDTGNTELALQIKQLEQKLEEQRTTILSPGFVSPFYIADASVRESDWNRILDQEEDILILAKNFGEMAEKLRLSLTEVSKEDVNKVELLAATLEDQMYARSRLV